MTTGARFLTVLAIVLPCAAGAQQPDPNAVGVVRAAIEYYRDTRLKGPVVIDPESPYHRGPLVSPAVVDRVVATTGAAKGRTDEHLDCREVIGNGRKQRTCDMRGQAQAVLTFSDLVIRGNTATLAVFYVKRPVAGFSAWVGEALTVVRDTTGRWKVEKAKETGVS